MGKEETETAAAESTAAAERQDDEGVEKEEEKKDEVLDGLFNETVRYLVVNIYVCAITELYA